MSLFITRLLILASLCALVFARVTPAADRVSKRQASRSNIVKRSATKAILKDFSARYPTAVRRQDSQVSAVPAPKCVVALDLEPGYAHYPNWDAPNKATNEAGTPIDLATPGAVSERECQAKCDTATDDNGNTCVGTFWWPITMVSDTDRWCSLKSSAYPYTPADFSNSNQYAVSPGAATDMRGSCAFWKQFVPAAMDAVCCDT